LWDLLPSGRQLGGAPTNFACHACALGADARVISRVGDDPNGREALERLSGLGLPTDCLEVDRERPTGTVGVEIEADGQPRFTIHENAAWDALQGTPAARSAVLNADAICFGTLAQRDPRSRATVRELVLSARPTALRLLDLNLRQNYFSVQLIEESLALANVLKVNETELQQLAALLRLGAGERVQITHLAERHGLKCIACTRGAKGSLLYAEGEWSDHPGIEVKVADTIGAGDAFSAAMILGLLRQWPLDEINRRAGEVAAFVCSRPGATPGLPGELRAAFQRSYDADSGAPSR
jgi:fructokinase